MFALVRMRLTGFVRTGRALAPLIAGLVVLGVLYGGGQAQAGEAYGVSAAVLFPVLAWQAKLLLDAEPDVQRRLALVAVGSRYRELVAGLLAATLAALVTVVVALVLPWLVGGIRGPRSAGEAPLSEGITLGVWAHLLAVPAAVALGALASRAATRSTTYGIVVLVGGAVGAVVMGLKNSVAPWLAPPVMATARALSGGPDGVAVVTLTLQALLWSAAVLTGYAWLRRRW
ncbi:hypothetical protein AB0J86_27115 [Micromonospora sp. NPDC049559]|uniref:hypothetical protein n=1 Tax=Micromonospora sp. NPDC049559 TaxID=3155923 RepID=UPI00342C806F